MIIKHCFEVRGLILATTLLTGLSFVTHATAEQHSLLIDLDSKLVVNLGSLGGGGTVARDINDAGQVVGSSRTIQGETHAFLTGPNGMGMSRVDTDPSENWSEAVGINNAGQVIGNYPSYYVDPEQWFMRASSFITGPNSEGRQWLDFQATGVNDAGVVVGWDFPKQPFTSSWLIYPAAYSGVYDGGTERISGLLSFDSQAELLAVNNSGQAVGVASGHAVLGSLYYPSTPPGLWTDIGALAGNYSSKAVGINEAGQIIGSYEANGVSHAFITNASATELIDLGTLGGLGSEALGINDIGQVVGWANTADGNRHAFITGPNGEGMIDLNSLVHLSEGGVLTTAMGINNEGQVIVLAIPEPETYALMLAGLGLIGFVGWRQKSGSRV
ncbi:PEP-CTERM protein-sorting domain-containing protein [Nitrosospira multiformis]|uniref:PEP-CTERM protein-sorting domain-containing protein n=1 Tax=Nitrosospira multiformis TaxID=1231 RepID=A0A1H9Z0V9_9PROT|nr:PEP-CTERM sorting domain-containing protein [Nitrosospira multiformis]SES75133.1 PEP-CTERM protein-sorting domain-containing protein [Nitrosospira multiformis]